MQKYKNSYESRSFLGFLERTMGLEPTTAAMARRYSSQLSYVRASWEQVMGLWTREQPPWQGGTLANWAIPAHGDIVSIFYFFQEEIKNPPKIWEDFMKAFLLWKTLRSRSITGWCRWVGLSDTRNRSCRVCSRSSWRFFRSGISRSGSLCCARFCLFWTLRSTRKRLTDNTITVSIKVINIHVFYFFHWLSIIVWCYLTRTLVVFCLSFCLSPEVRTVQVSFSFGRKGTRSHELESILRMSHTRFLDALSWEYRSEIEIVVHRLDTDRTQDNNSESYCYTCFDLTHPP